MGPYGEDDAGETRFTAQEALEVAERLGIDFRGDSIWSSSLPDYYTRLTAMEAEAED